MKAVLLAVVLSTLAGCKTAPAPRCAGNEQRSINELIYFGTATPDGAVTEQQWSDFLRDVVTPRFPQGLTTWPAAGQWRWPATDPRGRGSTAMTESERRARDAVQEALDRRDNGGKTGH